MATITIDNHALATNMFGGYSNRHGHHYNRQALATVYMFGCYSNSDIATLTTDRHVLATNMFGGYINRHGYH